MEYSVTISYVDPTDISKLITISLDTVNETSVSASSTITEHPTVEGTPIADHMYRNPIDLSLSGTFSLNGSPALRFVKDDKDVVRIETLTDTSLSRIEEIFEDIKNTGLICTISKIKVVKEDKTPQFTVRENMVLQSINWTEKINSLGFTFTFREVLTANVQTFDVDPDDRFLPDINYAEASTFSDTLLDWNAVDESVLKALLDYKLAAPEFLQFLASYGTGALIGLGIGSVAAIALASTLTAIGATASIPFVGAVIAAGIAAVIGIIELIKLIKKRAYKVKAFNYYKNAKKRNKEAARFTAFYEEMHNRIRVLDGSVKVWKINENKSQETILNIDNKYYIFNFEKNNIDSGYAYKLNVSNDEDTALSCTNTNVAIASYTDGTPQNCLFKTNKSYVYLVRSAEADANDLTKYFICASQINPVDFSQTLTDIIQEAIKY